MSTLVVVEEILRETSIPMSVREIVEHAGSRLPSKSKTPDTVVARDLSMDIKKKGDTSLFIRTSPGRYTLREIHRGVVNSGMGNSMGNSMGGGLSTSSMSSTASTDTTPVLTASIRPDRASPLPSSSHMQASASSPAVLRAR